jgi:hypothetical protein
MTEPTATDPLAEAIEAAIWKRYEGAEPSATGLVLANPRAVAAVAAAVARTTSAGVVQLPPTNQAALRDRIAAAIAEALKPRYGGPQHNTPGGLPLTATAEEVRLHRAQPLADAVLKVLPALVDRSAALRDFLWRMEQSAGDAAAEKFLDDNPELRRLAVEATLEPAMEDRPVAYRSYGARALYCVICARQEDRCEPATQVDEKAVCSFCGGNLLAVSSRTLGGVIAKYLEEAP